MSSERALGELGESTLRTWCAQVGITCNKSYHDRTGWDFLLEFPTIPSPQPFDLHPTPLKCWIQVKSTDRPKGNRTVSLSNWKRFVDTSEPAFFLALEFDGKPYCQRAFLVPVGEHYIRKVLKRLRKESTKPNARLNNLTMLFNYSNTDMLSELTGEGLKNAIESFVPNGMDNYISWKSSLKNTVGYDDGTHKITGKMLIPDEYKNRDIEELIVDFRLGHIPSLKVEGAEIIESRFGISSPSTKREFPTGKLLPMKLRPFAKASLLFIKSNHSARVEVEGEVFAASGLTGKYKKVEIRTAFVALSFQLSEGADIQSGNFDTITPPSSEKVYKLSELREFSDLIMLFNSCTQDDCVTVKLTFLAPDPQYIGDLQLNAEFLQAIRGWEVDTAQIIKVAYTISKNFDLQDRISVSLPQLMSITTEIGFFSALLDSVPSSLGIEFNGSSELLQIDFIRVIGKISFILDNYRFLAIYNALGKFQLNTKPQTEDAKFIYIFESNNVSLERKLFLGKDETIPFSIEELEKDITRKYPNDMFYILPFNAEE